MGKGDHEYAIPFYGSRRPILIDLIIDSDEEIRKRYYSIIKREGDVLIAETEKARPRGKPAVLWSKATPLYNPKGERIGAIESITGHNRIQEGKKRSRRSHGGDPLARNNRSADR